MKNNSNEAFEALKTFMVENYGAKIAAGGREIIKRCHFCGDSKDLSSKHLYIGLKNNGLIVYNCFKCQASGVVDGNFFRSLGCYNVDMITLCNKNNQSISSYKENVNKSRIVKSSAPILSYRDAPETLKKVEYISNRLNHPFTFEELASFKIILNLYDFIKLNNIGNLTRAKEICDQIDRYFIGFLSLDNAYILMRRLVGDHQVHPNIDTRYINYNIYGFQDNSSRYYVIPTVIDPSKKITINIAEGPFDILGVYLNTDSIKENSIFASIGGKSYLALIKFFIMNYGFINFDLHIYLDNDIDNRSIYNVINQVRMFCDSIFIHRNQFPNEKDYGVPKERIIDGIIKVQ